MQGKIPSLMGVKVRPMTNEESKLFLIILISEREGKIGEIDKSLRDNGSPLYMILTKRLNAFKMTCSPTLDVGFGPQIFSALLCDCPGKAVMWAYTLNEMFVKLGHPIKMADWVNEFPMGIPTEDEYMGVWDLQKQSPVERGLSDNKIDDFSNWGTP